MTTLKTRFASQAAKTLRTNMSDAERKLWSAFRNRQFRGLKFVRQLPIGPYIADFACRDVDLIIEVDGGQHAEDTRDDIRTRELAKHGYAVLRFWNQDILTNMDGVFAVLTEHFEKAPSPGLRFAKPDLSPEGRGEERPADLSPPLPGGRGRRNAAGEGAFPNTRTDGESP